MILSGISLKPLTKFALRSVLFLPIALWLWWNTLESLILPLNKLLAGSFLTGWFSDEGVSITLSETRSWVMATNFLVEEVPYARTWETSLNIVNTTLGLPFFWCLCAGFWHNKEQGKQLGYLLKGSLLVLLAINLNLILYGTHQLFDLMLLDEIQHLFLPDINIIKEFEKPSRFFTEVLSVSSDVLNYCAVFVIPLGYSYYVNREAFTEMNPAVSLAPDLQ